MTDVTYGDLIKKSDGNTSKYQIGNKLLSLIGVKTKEADSSIGMPGFVYLDEDGNEVDPAKNDKKPHKTQDGATYYLDSRDLTNWNSKGEIIREKFMVENKDGKSKLFQCTHLFLSNGILNDINVCFFSETILARLGIRMAKGSLPRQIEYIDVYLASINYDGTKTGRRVSLDLGEDGNGRFSMFDAKPREGENLIGSIGMKNPSYKDASRLFGQHDVRELVENVEKVLNAAIPGFVDTISELVPEYKQFTRSTNWPDEETKSRISDVFNAYPVIYPSGNELGALKLVPKARK